MKPGMTFGFFLLLLLIIGIVIQILRANRGKKFEIRKIAALDAIEESIGRAVELGRPVSFFTGGGGITDQWAPQTIAGLDVMSYTAGLCAKLGARLIYVAQKVQILPMANDLVRAEYVKAGAIDSYNELDAIRYVGEDQRALMAAGVDVITKEKVASNIMVGAFFWETIMLADHAAGEGAMQIGGTARQFQLPMMVACCDYCMLFEEMFAAGAYLSGDLSQIGSIAGQDACKYMLIALAIIAIILSFSPPAVQWFNNLIKL
jgi:hypothetical protein